MRFEFMDAIASSVCFVLVNIVFVCAPVHLDFPAFPFNDVCVCYVGNIGTA